MIVNLEDEKVDFFFTMLEITVFRVDLALISAHVELVLSRNSIGDDLDADLDALYHRKRKMVKRRKDGGFVTESL